MTAIACWPFPGGAIIKGAHALHRPSFMLTKPVLGTYLHARFEMNRIYRE
jgi:hypothetical protein